VKDELNESDHGRQDRPGELSEQDQRWLLGLINGFCYFQVLVAGCEIGLFTFLHDQGPADFEAVTENLRLPTHSCKVLLLAACEAGLLSRDPATRLYSATPLGALFARSNPDNLMDFVTFSNELVYQGMYRLTESLRQGTNVGLEAIDGQGQTIYERIAGQPRLERLFHEMMGSAIRRASVVHSQADVLPEIRHLLDVGGGTGVNAALLVRAHPGMRVTIFDLPSVVASAQKHVRQAGLTQSIGCVSGNLLTDDLPRGLSIDAVLFSHIAELFAPGRIRTFIRKSYDVLPEHGYLLFWSVVSNDEETGGPVAMRGSLYYHAVATGEGRAYPRADLERWFEEGGFDVVEVVEMQTDHALIVGQRR
jgi:ubiquinone/menaquinone biosynthesis C-methylase UbiE